MARIRGSRGWLIGNAIVLLFFTLDSSRNTKPRRIRLLQRQIHNQELLMDTLVKQLDGDDLDH
uniref:Putative ovule protein n=1 Tax=Solanum chacoense TaxID=4108 RepID=A0A0V0GV38_SOLCH